MNIIRGVGGVIKTPFRSGLIVVVLSVSIALALLMFIAASSSSAQIKSLKESVGTELYVEGGTKNSEAGGGMQTSMKQEAVLTAEQIEKLEKVPHIKKVNKSIVSKGNASINEASQDIKDRANLEPITKEENGAPPLKGLPVFPMYPDIKGVDGNGEEEAKDAVHSKNDDMPIEGRWLQSGDSRKVLMSRTIADKNHLKTGDTVQIYGKKFEVCGLFGHEIDTNPHPPQDMGHGGANTDFGAPTVLMPVKDMEEVSGLKDYSDVKPVVDNVDNVDVAAKEATAALGSTFKVKPPMSNNDGLIKGLASLQNFIWFGFISALVVSGLVIFFLMFLVVRNRRREIGIFKAIGGKTRGVMTQYSAEGLSLVALGCLVAFGFTMALAEGITKSLIAGVKPGDGPKMVGSSDPTGIDASNILVPIHAIGPALLIVAIVTLVGILIPVALTSRIRPIEAMRQE